MVVECTLVIQDSSCLLAERLIHSSQFTGCVTFTGPFGIRAHLFSIFSFAVISHVLLLAIYRIYTPCLYMPWEK